MSRKYTLNEWREAAIRYQKRVYDLCLSRANWRSKFEAEENKAASLTKENERLTRELAEARAAFDACLVNESKRNGGAVLEEKYSLAQP